MTYKAFRFSAHAAMRMEERSVSRREIKDAIVLGEVRKIDARQNKFEAQRRTKRGALTVHYREGKSAIFIITVYFDS